MMSSSWLTVKWSLDCTDLTVLSTGHPTIPPDSMLWKMCKLKLSHLDSKCGQQKPPAPCPSVIVGTVFCSI